MTLSSTTTRVTYTGNGVTIAFPTTFPFFAASEIEVIERFLPKALDEAESEAAIEAAVEEAGATSIKDMGRVMALLKERYPGRMDFAKASQSVKQRLA